MTPPAKVLPLHPDAVSALAETTAIKQQSDRQLLEQILDAQQAQSAKLESLHRAVASIQDTLQVVIYSRVVWPGVKAAFWLSLGGAAATAVLRWFVH